MTDIREHVTEEGQPYYDRRIYLTPSKGVRRAVEQALGTAEAKPILLGHQRIKLNWLKPEDIHDRKRIPPAA